MILFYLFKLNVARKGWQVEEWWHYWYDLQHFENFWDRIGTSIKKCTLEGTGVANKSWDRTITGQFFTFERTHCTIGTKLLIL